LDFGAFEVEPFAEGAVGRGKDALFDAVEGTPYEITHGYRYYFN
jgi:TRAP-type mannitol/chloroaromatic compound transport system substrate-binding protein